MQAISRRTLKAFFESGSAGMGFCASKYEFLDQLACYVQIPRSRCYLGGFCRNYRRARMKPLYWAGKGGFFRGIR